MTALDETREAWLGRAAEALSEHLLAEYDVPPLRISVGWPGGRSNRNRTIGQCWATSQARDGINQIFISPLRGEEETQNVLGTLLHEIIHAIDDCEHGHRKEFVQIARAVGFKSKWTSSDNRTDELNALLDEIGTDIGLFPHAALTTAGRAADTPKKQGTRMIKLEGECCGYTVRTTRKWIEVGMPACPCGNPMAEASA